MQVNLLYLMVGISLERIIKFITLDFSLIISPVLDNFSNPFRNNIFSIYSCHPIVHYGLYLVNENVFLLSYMYIWRVIKYDCVPIGDKANVLW